MKNTHTIKAFKRLDLKRLSLLLVVMFVFQSVYSLADVHQSHQSGIEHLSFEHKHEADAFNLDVEDEKQLESAETHSDVSGSLFDCHHCCHCHGLNVLGALGQVDIYLTSLISNESTRYLLKEVISPLNQQYRPPRS